MESNKKEPFGLANYDPESAEKTGYSNYSYWSSTWRVFIKKRSSKIFLAILLFLVIFTFIQPFLPNQKLPTFVNIDAETGRQIRNCKPNAEFWFGTNGIGQDLWARIWSGTRTSLFIGLTVGICDTSLGILIGALWGYVRQLDLIITEIYNVMNNIPRSIVLVLVSYMVKPSIGTVIFAMVMTGWVPTARIIRNQIVIIRDREFNLASRCLGASTKQIIFKNLLPQIISVIMMRISLSIPGAIGSEVFLAYIGLGLPPSMPSLGNLVNEGKIVMMSPNLRYQLIFPSIILSLITISFYVLGNAFADAADPKNHI